MSGWAEEPGGGLLADLIAAAYYLAEQRERDNEPCATCGGDCLRTDFTSIGKCHADIPGFEGASDTLEALTTNHENGRNQ